MKIKIPTRRDAGRKKEDMEQIIFTVACRQYGITIKTKSTLVNVEDRVIDSVDVLLLHQMHRLTTKYNSKNIAVLFEVE